MKVGFIGFGNMAQALAEGFAATGALKPCQIGACARDRVFKILQIQSRI